MIKAGEMRGIMHQLKAGKEVHSAGGESEHRARSSVTAVFCVFRFSGWRQKAAGFPRETEESFLWLVSGSGSGNFCTRFLGLHYWQAMRTCSACLRHPDPLPHFPRDAIPVTSWGAEVWKSLSSYSDFLLKLDSIHGDDVLYYSWGCLCLTDWVGKKLIGTRKELMSMWQTVKLPIWSEKAWKICQESNSVRLGCRVQMWGAGEIFMFLVQMQVWWRGMLGTLFKNLKAIAPAR